MKPRKQHDEGLYKYLNGELSVEEAYEYPETYVPNTDKKYAEIHENLAKIPNTVAQSTANKIHEYILDEARREPDSFYPYSKIKYDIEKLKKTEHFPIDTRDKVTINLVEVLGDYKLRNNKVKAFSSDLLRYKTENIQHNVILENKAAFKNAYKCGGFVKPKKNQDNKCPICHNKIEKGNTCVFCVKTSDILDTLANQVLKQQVLKKRGNQHNRKTQNFKNRDKFPSLYKNSDSSMRQDSSTRLSYEKYGDDEIDNSMNNHNENIYDRNEVNNCWKNSTTPIEKIADNNKNVNSSKKISF